jgi:[acyl-carrier-protein] S-malonyltransferase
MQTMGEIGVTAVIEVPPAGTLTGLIKRALPDVETVALKTPDDLDAARELVARHGSASPLDDSPTWRMLVAPAKGAFHRASGLDVGSRLSPGDVVGRLTGPRDDQEVTAPYGGTVVEWLVEDGDPVSPRQPLIRLHPEAVSS